MDKKKLLKLDIFSSVVSIFAALAAVGGIILLIYKFCGYPYLFESLVAFSLAFILFGMKQILDAFTVTEDIIVDYIGKAQAAINLSQTQAQTFASQQAPPGTSTRIIIDGTIDGMPLTNLDNLSEEQIEEIKSQIPESLHEAFDSMLKTRKDAQTTPPEKEKPVKEMSINELYIAQKKAVDTDKFEVAAKYQKEIERRQGKS